MRQLARHLYASMICATGLVASADTLFAAPSCYMRLYDGQHLARNPKQSVNRIMLAIDADNLGQAPASRFSSALRVNVKGVRETFTGNALCASERAQLLCGVEGDGGTFRIKPGSNDSLMIEVVGDGLRFEGNSGFAAVGGRVSDDNRFILSRVEFERCGLKPKR